MGTDDEAKHVEKLKHCYRLWSESKGSSFKPWLDLLAEGVRFQSLGGGSPGVEFSRGGSSRAEVMRYFDELSRDWQMLRYDMEHFIAQDDRVAVLGRCAWRNRRTDKVADTPKADFFRFENGRVVEFIEFYDTAAVVAAASE
jgi:ketosteroid isomerase-like protein